jgi:hypothetical protein
MWIAEDDEQKRGIEGEAKHHDENREASEDFPIITSLSRTGAVRQQLLGYRLSLRATSLMVRAAVRRRIRMLSHYLHVTATRLIESNRVLLKNMPRDQQKLTVMI